MLTAKQIFFALIIISVVLEIIGDILVKRGVVENRTPFIVGGFLIYVIGSLFWMYSLKYEYFSKAILIFIVLNMVIVVLVGVIFFRDELSLANKIGILLALASVVLIEQ